MRTPAAAAALAATILIGGCANFSANFSADYKVQSSETRTGVDRLVIRQAPGGGLGAVRFTTGAAGTVALHRTVNRNDARAPQERIGQSGGELTIDLDCPPAFGTGECYIDYDLTVPAGIAVAVDSSSDVVIDGVPGPLTIDARDFVSVVVAAGSGPYAVRATSTQEGVHVDVPQSPTGVPIEIRTPDRITVSTR